MPDLRLENRPNVLEQVKAIREVEALEQVNDLLINGRYVILGIAMGWDTKTGEFWINNYSLGELKEPFAS